jgi:hypothetical protein
LRFFATVSGLPAQSQPTYHLVVSLDINPLQVVEQTSALLDHLQQSSARVIILLMRLEVLGEFVDSLA